VIVTLATPHMSPIVAFDKQLSRYYEDVSRVWRSERQGRLQNVTMASIGGGDLDLIVRSGLTYSWEADVSTVVRIPVRPIISPGKGDPMPKALLISSLLY